MDNISENVPELAGGAASQWKRESSHKSTECNQRNWKTTAQRGEIKPAQHKDEDNEHKRCNLCRHKTKINMLKTARQDNDALITVT